MINNNNQKIINKKIYQNFYNNKSKNNKIMKANN